MLTVLVFILVGGAVAALASLSINDTFPTYWIDRAQLHLYIA